MLILRRRAGESIQIGEAIKITILDASESAVRVAIDAPREIPVLRSELVQAADANRDAALEQAAPADLLSILDRKNKAAGGR